MTEKTDKAEADAKPQRQRGPSTPPDPEIAAMAALVRAMTPLDGDTRDRVREWFTARYGDTSGLAQTRTAEWSKRNAEQWARDSQDGRPVGAEP
jgi:hypothetical protein